MRGRGRKKDRNRGRREGKGKRREGLQRLSESSEVHCAAAKLDGSQKRVEGERKGLESPKSLRRAGKATAPPPRPMNASGGAPTS